MAEICVIVPVYKVEAYLNRCIRSILSQSYQDFILILVDDGSPDNSGALCDSWARKDSRIHVIHQKNGGLSAARNAGLEYLLSKTECQWVTFVDSDDWIHPNMLEQMLTAAQEMGTNISICGFQETTGEGFGTNLESKWQIWKPEDFYLKHIVDATIACAKLYRIECFKNLRFPVGKLHEDEFITYQLLLPQKAITVVDVPLYAYYVNYESITKSKWNPKRLDAWEAFEQQLVFFEEHGYPELVKFRLRNYLENALVNLDGAKSIGDEKSVRFIEKRIRNLIRRCWHAEQIHFQYDYEILEKFYPVTTKIYRFYLERIKK